MFEIVVIFVCALNDSIVFHVYTRLYLTIISTVFIIALHIQGDLSGTPEETVDSRGVVLLLAEHLYMQPVYTG